MMMRWFGSEFSQPRQYKTKIAFNIFRLHGWRGGAWLRERSPSVIDDISAPDRCAGRFVYLIRDRDEKEEGANAAFAHAFWPSDKSHGRPNAGPLVDVSCRVVRS
jgi:hypothetical protein